MATLIHSCMTCAYYEAGASACLGACTHPARRSQSDVTIYVRNRELPCRVDWGVDLWVEDTTGAPAPRVVGLLIWGPIADGVPADDFPDDLLQRLIESGEE